MHRMNRKMNGLSKVQDRGYGFVLCMIAWYIPVCNACTGLEMHTAAVSKIEFNLQSFASTLKISRYRPDMLSLECAASNVASASSQIFHDPTDIAGQIRAWLKLVEYRWGSYSGCGGLPFLIINGLIKVCLITVCSQWLYGCTLAWAGKQCHFPGWEIHRPVSPLDVHLSAA